MNSPDTVTRLNAALQGRYAIERELGEGGMATVYLAKDLKHDRIRRFVEGCTLYNEAPYWEMSAPERRQDRVWKGGCT